MTAPDPRRTIFMSPDDTVAAWRERDALVPTVDWTEMQHEQHATAFTVAKIAKLDLLGKVQQSLGEHLLAGRTFEAWKASILPELQRAGWWGVVQDEALTGTPDAIVVNDRRLRNIYRTNMRMSIAAGRWRKAWRERDLFPYIRYRSDHWRRHPRKQHLDWHGVILPIDHSAWRWMWPPNGWACNCKAEQVSEGRMRRNGWSVSTRGDDLANPPKSTYRPLSGPAIEKVPEGVQPGFGYNPGIAHLRAVADRLLTTVRREVDAGRPEAAQRVLREIVHDRAFEQFAAMPEGQFPIAILTGEQQQMIGAPQRVVTLPGGVYRKQLGEMPDISRGHPELTIADYRRLPDLVERALVVAQQGDNRLIYFSDQDRIWKVVVRYDSDREYPAIVSFHGSSARKINGEVRRLRILLDRR